MRQIITTSVEYPSNGPTASGYLARPKAGGGLGVVVIQEWWGLDAHIRDVTERFTREGYVALAPDLYHGKVAAPHTFFNDTRPSVYRPDAAQDAWRKTLDWFGMYLC